MISPSVTPRLTGSERFEPTGIESMHLGVGQVVQVRLANFAAKRMSSCPPKDVRLGLAA